MRLGELETEMSNPKTETFHELPTIEMLKVMNEEDAVIPLAVRDALSEIALAVDACAGAVESGGRIIYAGAGTSGRLGVLDAAEVVPTFGVSDDLFVALMAGGREALVNSAERAEDGDDLGVKDAREASISESDVVVGITASGRTPYVKGILQYSRQAGAKTVLISNVANPQLQQLADITIVVRTGPEVISGSTRLKAGTAQKIVLNMLSTVTMVRLGRVIGNQMVALRIMNEKLVDRAVRIVSDVSGLSYDDSERILEEAGREVPLATLIALSGKSKEDCNSALKEARGNVRLALKKLGGSA
ncbi:MAG TPA: N-acetylmuramic acid 6-phosphate etherase [Kosmotogaceae bacterium]|nr:MAG: N-acetylmuramic acid 6-phosphate etherase [Thermotogales bacterium 46_20]HAA86437.1 N-acetylmuramic acid 6-phosphate etherase [Kosmotogaceae bacterium]